jgi:uncharacterized protein (DUF1501 family)
MTTTQKAPVFVIVQLTGGNDFMNTVIPYGNDMYYDFRPLVAVPQKEVLPINDQLAFNPNAAPLKEIYDDGKMAIIQGVGYPDSSRSHFRGMDIWHTCEPDTVATEGWLGKVVREMDPNKENPLTAINFGRGMPRALSASGTAVTSVSNLDTYGLMTGISEQQQREQALRLFQRMYGPAIGTGKVRDYMAQTGLGVLKGADVLKNVPAMYRSDIEYADNPIAKSLRDVARVHLANVGTRIFYTQHGGYDTHANEGPVHPRLIGEVSGAISDFFADLRAHDAADNVVMLVFTEFGRRIRDNGSGTDHGAGGGSFVIGDIVKGGLYGEYPSLEPSQHDSGDMRFTYDFRGLYTTLLEQMLKIEAAPIVGGHYEQVSIFG